MLALKMSVFPEATKDMWGVGGQGQGSTGLERGPDDYGGAEGQSFQFYCSEPCPHHPAHTSWSFLISPWLFLGHLAFPHVPDLPSKSSLMTDTSPLVL